MQNILEKIFNMAIRELPDKLQTFHNEEAVLYRGFKISRSGGKYSWHDIRYNDYYEVVDPLITEKILEKGFSITLNEVMLHNDKDKVINLSREVEEKDALIAYWVTKSSKIWADYNRKVVIINKEGSLTNEVKKVRKHEIRSRYEKKKNLYQKKREVISKERDELKADIKFFESRIKLYNNYNKLKR